MRGGRLHGLATGRRGHVEAEPDVRAAGTRAGRALSSCAGRAEEVVRARRRRGLAVVPRRARGHRRRRSSGRLGQRPGAACAARRSTRTPAGRTARAGRCRRSGRCGPAPRRRAAGREDGGEPGQAATPPPRCRRRRRPVSPLCGWAAGVLSYLDDEDRACPAPPGRPDSGDAPAGDADASVGVGRRRGGRAVAARRADGAAGPVAAALERRGGTRAGRERERGRRQRDEDGGHDGVVGRARRPPAVLPGAGGPTMRIGVRSLTGSPGPRGGVVDVDGRCGHRGAARPGGTSGDPLAPHAQAPRTASLWNRRASSTRRHGGSELLDQGRASAVRRRTSRLVASSRGRDRARAPGSGRSRRASGARRRRGRPSGPRARRRQQQAGRRVEQPGRARSWTAARGGAAARPARPRAVSIRWCSRSSRPASRGQVDQRRARSARRRSAASVQSVTRSVALVTLTVEAGRAGPRAGRGCPRGPSRPWR